MSDDKRQPESERGNENPVDPRFADDPVTVHGTPRQRRRKLTKVEQAALIEEIRELQLLEHNKSDILDRIKVKWGLTRKSIKRYVSYACSKNRSLFGGEDSVAIACSWWASEKREAIERFKTESKSLEVARQTYFYAEKVLRQADAKKDDQGRPFFLDEFERADLVTRQETAGRLMENCRKAMFGAKQDAQNAQREIDKIKGNIIHRHARTDTKGNDVLNLTPQERSEKLRRMGVKPALALPLIEVEAVDVTDAVAPIANGHHAANDHANSIAAIAALMSPPVNGTNGHAHHIGHSNGHAQNGHPKPPAGGDDDLQ